MKTVKAPVFKKRISHKPHGKLGNPNPKPSPNRWKKGMKSPNPLGSAAIPLENRIPLQVKLYTRQSVCEAYNKYVVLSLAELREKIQDDSLPMLEAICVAALYRDKLEGTLLNTEIILDRIIGKVVQKTEMSGANGAPLVPPQINFLPVAPNADSTPVTPVIENKVDPIQKALPQEEQNSVIAVESPEVQFVPVKGSQNE